MEIKDSHALIFSAVKKFFTGTLLSRMTGFLRDLTMAFCFGSAPQVALFMVAFRLAHLLRRLFGEGALQGGFVPHFELLRKRDEVEAAQFYRDLGSSLMLTAGAIVAVGMGLCWIVHTDLFLMMLLMLPSILFLSLYALDSAVLQCKKRYFLGASAPALFNVVWIIAALFLRRQEIRSAMFGLSACVLLAFAAQWWVTARPVLRWVRSMPKQGIRLFSPEVRSLFKPLSFSLIGVGAAQINGALDALFATLAHPSGPAYLWYAIRIEQLPLALLGIAFANALLPPLSRAAQAGNWDLYRDLQRKALRKCTLLLLPCTIGMLTLADFGIGILYGHGAFLKTDVAATALCLKAYALGLIPTAYTLLLANGFYARKEYKHPMRCSLLAIATNALLNTLFVFVFAWGPAGIALATSLGALVNVAALAGGLRPFAPPAKAQAP